MIAGTFVAEAVQQSTAVWVHVAGMVKATVQVEVPSELVPEMEGLLSYLREVSSRDASQRDLLAEERSLQERLNAVGRAAMGGMLSSADTHGPEIEIDGATWGNRRTTVGEYETLFGTVTVPRSIYQQDHVGGAVTRSG